MRKCLTFLFIAQFFLLSPIKSQALENAMSTSISRNGDLGLGLKVGSFTGLSAKYWLAEAQAWDAMIAFNNGNIAFGIDYLFHFSYAIPGTGRNRIGALIPYTGIGLLGISGRNNFVNKNFETFDGSFELAARVPIGIELMPSAISLGIFAELGLGLSVYPSTYTFLMAEFGLRYYF